MTRWTVESRRANFTYTNGVMYPNMKATMSFFDPLVGRRTRQCKFSNLD